MIKRFKQYEIVEYLQYFPVLGIVGPRQVGKTTLAKMLMHHILQKETIYIDLENPEDESKLSDPVLFFKSNQDNCVILDEIQRRPDLFSIMRSMIDMNRVPARFVLLGSASPHLIRNTSETLAGRIVYEELAPFNLIEISTKKDIFYHWFAGGFPEAFSIKTDRIRKVWFANFIKTYVERDLPMLGLKIESNIIRKLWIMIAHLNGNILNYATLSRSLGLTSPTIKSYMSFLEGAFLIRTLHPFSVNVKKRLIKSPKIYIRDTGILHHLLGIGTFSDLQSNPILGNSWEGYVIEQITQKVSHDFACFYYRTQNGAECDLVLVKSDKPIASIEVKYTSSPKTSKGMLQAFSDLDAKYNFVITPSTENYLLRKNIRICSLNTFLEKYLGEI